MRSAGGSRIVSSNASRPWGFGKLKIADAQAELIVLPAEKAA